jgi:hypothetical protein
MRRLLALAAILAAPLLADRALIELGCPNR